MTIKPSPDFRSLFEGAPGLYLVLTPDFRIAAVSDAYLQATMTVRDQIIGRGIFEVFPDNPDDPSTTGVQNLRASLECVLRTKQPDAMPVQKYDIQRPESEGGGFEARFWSPRNSPVKSADGELTYIIHEVEDVTEFIRKEEERQADKRHTAALQTRAEQMESEIVVRAKQAADANRDLRNANARLGVLYDQIVCLMMRADQELALPTTEQAQSMSPEEMLKRIERLITEHRRLEEHVRQSQKMEAIGRLAGGIAHDFNNLLTVITGQTVLLQQQTADGPSSVKLKAIEQAAQRASALTSQLLTFSRKQIVQERVVDLDTIISGLEDMLRRLIGEHIIMTTVLGSGAKPVKVDRTQIELVLMNLAVNARDAMPDGGRLTIETCSRTLQPGQVGSLQAGAYVVVSVSDTGHGMDPDTAARIFEPFFTTKPAGSGTGLGLATAVGVAAQSGGELCVESRIGEGTTFRLYLPVSNEASTPPVAAEIAAPAAGAGTVLVVEDHPPLRELLETVLSKAGYQVQLAANASEALRIGEDMHIDVVLTDVVMPGMSGIELAERLRERQSSIRIIFMSGYDQGMLQARGAHSHILQKPFTPRTLVKLIAEVLAANPIAS
jgi:signal transduction histidine kinase/CheY-like chemotaxis protein